MPKTLTITTEFEELLRLGRAVFLTEEELVFHARRVVALQRTQRVLHTRRGCLTKQMTARS